MNNETLGKIDAMLKCSMKIFVKSTEFRIEIRANKSIVLNNNLKIESSMRVYFQGPLWVWDVF